MQGLQRLPVAVVLPPGAPGAASHVSVRVPYVMFVPAPSAVAKAVAQLGQSAGRPDGDPLFAVRLVRGQLLVQGVVHVVVGLVVVLKS